MSLEAVAMRLLAYKRDARYPSAAHAATDLLRCQGTPRDGRADLVRLLDARFPPAHRAQPRARPAPAAAPPSPSTLTESAF